MADTLRHPQDGHTQAGVVDGTEVLTGRNIERVHADKGCRGDNTTNPQRAFLSGQRRGVFGTIKRDIQRRSAIEAVIRTSRTTATSADASSKNSTAMPPPSHAMG